MTDGTICDSAPRVQDEPEGWQPSLADAVRWKEYRASERLSTGVAGLDSLTGGLELGALWLVTGDRGVRAPLLQQIAGTVDSGGLRTVLVAPLEHGADVVVGCATRSAGVDPDALHPTDNAPLLRRMHRRSDSSTLSVCGADADPGEFLAATLWRVPLPRVVIIDDLDLVQNAVLKAVEENDLRGEPADLGRLLRRFARRHSVTVIAGLDRTTSERYARNWADAADIACCLEQESEGTGSPRVRALLAAAPNRDEYLHYDPTSHGYRRFDQTSAPHPCHERTHHANR